MATSFKPGFILSAIAVGLLMPGPSSSQPGLPDAEFRTIHRLLQPTEEEAWQKVPWKLSILEAQNQAAKEKKPVFMLVRSGHPLGCV
jgi:hypothetical protein